jgi:hypothetical protein
LANDAAQKIELQGTKPFVGLWPGDAVFSPSGNIKLSYDNGNLILSRAPDDICWSTSKPNPSLGHAWMQDDGNLVIYDAAGAVVWASDTDLNPGAYLVIRDDCHVVITSPSGSTLRSFP